MDKSFKNEHRVVLENKLGKEWRTVMAELGKQNQRFEDFADGEKFWNEIVFSGIECSVLHKALSQAGLESYAELLAGLLESGEVQDVLPPQLASHRSVVGRGKEVARITSELRNQVVVLHGQGGMGKSALAAEVAKHHPGVVLFVSGDSWLAVVQSMRAELSRAKQHAPEGADQILVAFQRHLDSLKNLLLVVDNADDPTEAFCKAWLPSGGKVLVTSRAGPVWFQRSQLRGACFIEIEKLSNSAAVELLQKLSRQEICNSEERKAACELVGRDCIDGLPLAIEQVAAAMLEMSGSPTMCRGPEYGHECAIRGWRNIHEGFGSKGAVKGKIN